MQHAALQLLDVLLSKTQQPLAEAVVFVLQLAPTFEQHANRDCRDTFFQILKGLWQRLAAEPGAKIAMGIKGTKSEGDEGAESGQAHGNVQEQLQAVELLLFIALAEEDPAVFRVAVEFWDQVLPRTPYERLEVGGVRGFACN